MNNTYTQEVNEYANEMDESTLDKYVNKVYRLLLDMEPGQKIILKKIVKPLMLDLFKAVVKMFIDESGWSEIEFSREYEGIRKTAWPY